MAKPINDEGGIRVGHEEYSWKGEDMRVKVAITKDEQWPFYIPKLAPQTHQSNLMGTTITEIPVELYEKWENVMEQFKEVQKEIKKYYQQGE